MYGLVFMSTRVIATSRMFQKGKTVVPSEVRRILGVVDGDNIAWIYNESESTIVILTSKKAARYMLER